MVPALEDQSDESLVRTFLDGDERAFATLMERHLSLAYKFIYRYLRNVDDTNDVTQETFMKAWRYIRKFDTEKKFTAWLLAIAKNTALDFIKKKKPLAFSQIEARAARNDEASGGDLDAFLAPYVEAPELPAVAIDRKGARAELEGALQKIAPSYRMVLNLRYVDHLKFREIAELLHEPIDTVKSKHRRGLALLRSVIGSDSERFRT